MNTTMKPSAWLLALALAATATLTACSSDDDNDNKGGGTEQTDSNAVTTYNDLDYFQNAIIEVDSLGQMLCRSYGEVLDESEPEHIYIGVDNLTEAETMFRQWIAPDITISTTIPTTNGLTCPLTDEQGKAQGTIYFTPGSGTSVAEVTASSGTNLKHFNRITFLQNSAWPHNASIYNQFTQGDIITFTPGSSISEKLKDNDKTLKWVCIRKASNGVKPMFCALTNSKYTLGYGEYGNTIRKSDYCPGESKAKSISKTLRESWDFYVQAFNEAGCGKLAKGTAYWIDHSHGFLPTFYDYIYWESGATYGSKAHEMDLQFLLKIDWMEESAIKSNLYATSGSPGVSGDENYVSLFDGQTSTKWCTYTSNKPWYVEFNAPAPVYATGYKMTTANDCSTYKNRNPKSWKLYGKGDLTDEWVLMAQVSNSNMADVNFKTYDFTVSKPDYYMYFRLVVDDNYGAGVMQISEVSLITQDPDYD